MQRFSLLISLLALPLAGWANRPAMAAPKPARGPQDATLAPYVSQAVRVGQVASLRAVAEAAHTAVPRQPATLREVPRGDLPKYARSARQAQAQVVDPVAQRSHPAAPNMPAPLITFEGVPSLDSVTPPDPNGDVGINQYISMVNMHFSIYDKQTGTNLLPAPILMSSLFAAAGFPPPASTTDNGDPIVIYDHLAGRWLISQFIVDVTPCHEVIGISMSEDATGGWYLYDFVMPNAKMNDYPHFGLWPDGYYMTDNQFNPDNSWGGAGVFVFDRAKMLIGDTNATYQYFDLYGANADFSGMLPADLDGPPPPAGAPCLFGMVDHQLINPLDAFYTWEFHVDWTTPANSTFGHDGQPNYTNVVAAFNWTFPNDRNTVPQPGTTQKLDPIGDRIMHRLQYRNFGAHESLVANHTVNVGSEQAGVRYYELRRPTAGGAFAVREQATFAPDTACRWMGSAAMDSQGNLAVGYSVSSASVYPSIRYAGRLAGDPSNGLYQGEAELWAGAASQVGANRWGDYTSLSVDPVDNVTFWYMNEYTTGGYNWRTRIGSFRLGAPNQGRVAGVVTNTFTGLPVADALVTVTNLGYFMRTDASGVFGFNLPTGTYTLVASADQFFPATLAGVDVLLDTTTTVAIGVAPFGFQVHPASGLTAAGNVGGPFTPASKTYFLTNESAGALSWTSTWSAAWVTVTPAGGSLAPRAGAAVTVAFNSEASFLPFGQYLSAVVFTNQSGAEAATRTVALTVNPDYVLHENFEDGLPAGWTIVTGGDPDAYWRFDDPCSEGNLTGSTGLFAMADSDCAGEVDMDTQLRTPVLNLEAYTNVWVAFNSDFRAYSENEYGEVDYSLNGAAGPWANLLVQRTDVRGPTNLVLNFRAAAGSTNVMLRFHYYNAYYDYWWEVDNVRVYGQRQMGALTIVPPGGVALAGYYGGPFLPTGQEYLLRNGSAGALTWTARLDCAWLAGAPLGGTLAVGETSAMTVTVNSAANAYLPGAYDGALVFSNVTGGGVESRTMNLAVIEPMEMAPTAGLTATGLEGGPFSPGSQDYLLTNHAGLAMGWTSSWTAAWLQVVPAGGTLAAGGSATVNVGLLAPQLNTPGVFTDTVTFSNHVTGATFARAVEVTVIEINGEIAVYDSIPPTNDLKLPFGALALGTSRVEHITVRNDSALGRNLVVTNILFGYYRENFASGTAAGWQPTVPAEWSVVNQEYRALGTQHAFMVSTYLPQTWADCSLQVLMHRAGNTNNSEGIALRATEDFDAISTGSAYMFLWSGLQYSVWRAEGGTFTPLQAWTLTTVIRPGTATNILLASISSNQLRFVINNTLVWEGSDSALAAGHIALCGYSIPASSTTHYFDNVAVNKPVTQILGLGRKQHYLNAHAQPKSRPKGAGSYTPAAESAAPDLAMALLEDYAPASAAVFEEPFTITNLPALPATVAPGSAFTFDVIFAPLHLGSNDNIVTIMNNDNQTPVVSVDVSGRTAAGRVVGKVYAQHSGQPLAGAQVTAWSGQTDLATTTGTNGSYSLALFTGGFDLSAAKANYVTGLVSGLDIPADGAVVTQNFWLVGSVLSYAPTAMVRTVEWPQAVTNQLVVSNSGPRTVAVTMQLATTADSGGTNVVFEYNVGAASGDSQCLGVEWDGVNFWVTGGGSSANPNYLYKFDAAGQLITNYEQGTSSDWGWRDLAFDGTYLYASDSATIQQISRATGQATGTTIPGPLNPNRGLAYDPASDHFWVANFESSIYEINRAGTVLHTYASTNSIYGLAWDNLSPDGPWLWVWSQGSNPECHLTQFNPRTGVYTGVTRPGATPPGGLAGGAAFGDFNGTATFIGLQQADASDYILGYGMTDLIPTWPSLATNAVTLAPGAADFIDVLFDSSQVTNDPATYHAFVRFSGDYVNQVAALPLTMIIPGLLEVSPAALAFTANWGGPAPSAQTYLLTNHAGTVSFTNVVTYGPGASGWFLPGADSGTLAAGAVQAYTGAVNPGAMAPGVYHATNSFVALDTGRVLQRLPVTLTLIQQATVSGPFSSNVTATAAFLGGEITAAPMPVTERGVFWSTNSAFGMGVPGTRVSEFGTFGTGVFGLPVTGLVAGTTNYFVAFAANAWSTSHTALATFLTLPPAPSAQSATNISAASFHANWQAARSAQAYFLDVATNSTFDGDGYLAGFSNRNAGTALSWPVTGVASGRVCYYRVRAQNDTGMSANSATITVTRTANLTMASSPANGGSTAPTSGVHVVNLGQVYNVTATPRAGWQFRFWQLSGTAGVVNTNKAATQINPQANCSLTAVFRRRPAPVGAYMLLIGETNRPVAVP